MGMFENFGLLKKTRRGYYIIGTWKRSKSKYITVVYANDGWDRADKSATALGSKYAHFANFSLLLLQKFNPKPHFWAFLGFCGFNLLGAKFCHKHFIFT